MEILAEYQNGNYRVTLYPDGTKIKQTQDDVFLAAFPDSMDLKITNRCDLACPMCHENAEPNGPHGDLHVPFLDTLQRGTELAIGGGNPLTHPELFPFLRRMKDRGVVCNMTVNEHHLHRDQEQILSLLEEKLIYGLGISLSSYEADTLEFAKEHPNTVLHLICGMVSQSQWEMLFDRNLKILFLGYKHHGRGVRYYSAKIGEKIRLLRHALPDIMERFDVVSFDNLALDQLSVRKLLTKGVFEETYMGDDGEATMYVDLVKGEFGLSSTASLRYPILDSAQEMLQFLHQIKSKTRE